MRNQKIWGVVFVKGGKILFELSARKFFHRRWGQLTPLKPNLKSRVC